MIIFFSGTGNTRLCANTLSQLTGDKAIELTAEVLLNPQNSKLEIAGRNDRIIWMFPVYSWGIPPMVRRVIENIHIDRADKARHYMVCTCGDDCGLTDSEFTKIITRRQWATNRQSCYSVTMPNTYVFMKGFDVDHEAVVRLKLQQAPHRLRQIAADIDSPQPQGPFTHHGSFAWPKSHIIRPWFKRFAMSPRPFHATEACKGCGACTKICPLGNITMTNTPGSTPRPQWHETCTLCTRCYHSCPRNAVAYGKTTRHKGQYKGPHPR